jgi:hypothetical protein
LFRVVIVAGRKRLYCTELEIISNECLASSFIFPLSYAVMIRAIQMLIFCRWIVMLCPKSWSLKLVYTSEMERGEVETSIIIKNFRGRILFFLSLGQETSRLSLNPKVYFRIHKSSLLDPVLRQMNSAHTNTPFI